MGRIHALSENVIGKIAAGEVVERPAAAIKELTENSLDAGATSVTVEIRAEVADYFRVTDNGSGIEPADLKLAFERHATSKIWREEDLNAIWTLGFRGEALASIAAVGRVTLVTRTEGMDSAVKTVNEGGRILSMEETAAPRGTTIIVRDLFFNTPVRRNFLKKPAAEAGAVTDLMVRLILSRPDVSFRLISQGRTVYHSPGDGNPASAIQSVFGSAALRQMRPVDGHMNGVLLKGYVGIGELARSNRNGEFFFINRRMMRSASLSAALENACRERVMIGRFPMGILNLEVPYESVNVNVHPNKLEVRFQNEPAVCQAVETLVHEALQDRDAFDKPVAMTLTKPDDQPAQPESSTLREAVRTLREEPKVSVIRTETVPPAAVIPEQSIPRNKPDGGPTRDDGHESKAGALEKGKAASGAVGGLRPFIPPAQTVLKETAEQREAAHPENQRLPKPSAEEEHQGLRNGGAEAAPEEGDMPEKPGAAPGEMLSREVWQEEQLTAALPPEVRPIKIYGALFDTYILIEYENHLLLVDQHAVHERLLFDRLMAAFGHEKLGQEMLTPVTLPVTREEMRLLEENRKLLEDIGLVTEPFGETDIAVRTMPVILGDVQPADFLRDVIGELEAGRVPSFEKKRAALLQTACKHAVKGGEKLDEDQLRHLVEQMIDQKVTPTCPHGRPLVVSISRRELDKKFKRIQE